MEYFLYTDEFTIDKDGKFYQTLDIKQFQKHLKSQRHLNAIRIFKINNKDPNTIHNHIYKQKLNLIPDKINI